MQNRSRFQFFAIILLCFLLRLVVIVAAVLFFRLFHCFSSSSSAVVVFFVCSFFGAHTLAVLIGNCDWMTWEYFLFVLLRWRASIFMLAHNQKPKHWKVQSSCFRQRNSYDEWKTWAYIAQMTCNVLVYEYIFIYMYICVCVFIS